MCDQKNNSVPKILTEESKSLSSPSLVEDNTLKLSVKEKAKLFMKDSHNSSTKIDSTKNLKHTDKTEKPRPLSQVLNESLKQKNKASLYINGKNNISLSTNKLDSEKIFEKSNSYSTNLDSLDKYLDVEKNNNHEQKFMTVKEKVTYFSSINNQKKSDSKRNLNFS